MSAVNDIEQAVRKFLRATDSDECPCCGAPGNSDVEERPKPLLDLWKSVGIDLEPTDE
jgi:hypothetical protein